VKKNLLVLWMLGLSLFLCSCAHIKSGRYVKIQKNETLGSLAKEFRTPEWRLKLYNKDRRFVPGEWIFIPQDRGLIESLDQMGLGDPQDPSPFFVKGDFLWPLPSSYHVTSTYGERGGREHEGIDISSPAGNHILAAQDGIVVYSGSELGGYGNLTVIAHNNNLFTVYAHAKKNYTRTGQQVNRGQVIAQVGSTGRSTGPHLHFEIRRDSVAYNPIAFLSKK
jgi:murein DD-endopeptidase MepM/ murein hydrolase activator NlpD